MDVDQIKITYMPDERTGGMKVPAMPKGVRVEHTETGTAVECNLYRQQHKNKDAALAVLELLLIERREG